ncbi:MULTISPECIES: DUF1048 domain-containing protein [unclassified Microbacterium]|uniref:DUF1048 domain-containing protein n=1 Tax=unclassified Microbacterium TaxID=2609290 RepID=UPI00109D475F|nr:MULTISPECIES: DUF1048 domain-containing protein [unclassified Microbacterium]
MAQQISTVELPGEAQMLTAIHSTTVVPLPADFRAVLTAFATYLDHRPLISRTDAAAGALDDLASLFAEAAAAGMPIRDVVGHDPAEVAEALLENYALTARDADARADLARAIDVIVGELGG